MATSSSSLLPLVARGDSRAMRQCMLTHQRLVRAIARRFVRGEAEIDDAVQDVFVDVWRSAKRFDGRTQERTFIAMITRRRLIDRLRRSRRRPTTESFDERVNPPESAGAAATVEAASEAALAAKHIQRLRPAQQHVLLLSAVRGMSHSEIAHELDMPLGTVKAHAKRGMAELRSHLAAA